MICRCQGASFVSSYPRVLSFSDCSFSFSSSSRFSFSCSFLLSGRGHRARRSPEPRSPPCPPRQGRGSRHSPFLLPAKAKGRVRLAEPRECPAGAASPEPGSPLLLQLLAQDVPPPGRHAGQARLLFFLLQQRAVLPALRGAALTAGTVGPSIALVRGITSFWQPYPCPGPAGVHQHTARRGAPHCPPSAGAGRRRSGWRGQPLQHTTALLHDTRGPTLPRHRKRHSRGERSPAAAPPARHTATASGTHCNPGLGPRRAAPSPLPS